MNMSVFSCCIKNMRCSCKFYPFLSRMLQIQNPMKMVIFPHTYRKNFCCFVSLVLGDFCFFPYPPFLNRERSNLTRHFIEYKLKGLGLNMNHSLATSMPHYALSLILSKSLEVNILLCSLSRYRSSSTSFWLPACLYM